MPTKTPRQEAHRGGPPRPLALILAPVLKRDGMKRGFSGVDIMTDWPAIVGADMARYCVPEKLAHGKGVEGGTLHLRVAGAWATELQHLEPVILERINGHFGYRAVARLKLTQGPIENRPRQTLHRPKPLDPDSERRLANRLAGIDDEPLRNALARLGRSVLGSELKD